MIYKILNSYLDNKAKKDRNNTLITYKSEIMQLYNFIIDETKEYKTINSEKELISSIDYISLCEFLNHKDYKPSAYNKKLAIIKDYFNFLYSAYIIERDISKPINFMSNEKVQETIREKEIINKEEVKKIINACKSNKDKLILSIMFSSGCRIGEVLQIEIDWISKVNIDDEEIIKISIPKKVVKNTVDRVIYLVDDMIDYFNAYVETERSKKKIVKGHEKYLFITNGARSYLTIKDDKVTVRSGEINKKLKTIMNDLGINKKITNHCFRHSHVVECQGQGMDLVSINDNIGWKVNNPLFTTYSKHNTEEKTKNIINTTKALMV